VGASSGRTNPMEKRHPSTPLRALPKQVPKTTRVRGQEEPPATVRPESAPWRGAPERTFPGKDTHGAGYTRESGGRGRPTVSNTVNQNGFLGTSPDARIPV
jgi:hypothetical protein